MFLAIGQILVGPPRMPIPDLAVVGATALLPMVVGLRIVRTVGTGTAICGAYLLPASTVSLLVPSVPPPPLLLVPAVVFDLVVWLEPAHLDALLDLLPGVRRPRRLVSASWRPSTARSSAAGAAFGLVFALVEPPFRVFLGGDPSLWFGLSYWMSLIATTLVCASVATLLTVRGTAA